MKEIFPSYFFDVSSFQHAALFNEKETVWNVLESLEDYLKELPLGNIHVEIPKGAFLVERHLISIGKGTIIEPGAYIKGPCFIGENCTVRHGAYIRGNFISGKKCVIGHDTEVKHAIMLDGAQASHFAYVGDSILGNRVNLGAGTKCANLRFDHESVIAFSKEERFNTGLHKLGAILGDDTQMGCNVVTNPGTLFGKGVWCYPCINVGGFVPSNSIVKGQVSLVISLRA